MGPYRTARAPAEAKDDQLLVVEAVEAVYDWKRCRGSVKRYSARINGVVVGIEARLIRGAVLMVEQDNDWKEVKLRRALRKRIRAKFREMEEAANTPFNKLLAAVKKDA